MKKVYEDVLSWSEVWALAIPLLVLLFRPKQPSVLKPVIVYLWLALIINLTGDIIADYKKYLPDWLQSNNPLYNIHSVVRFICFCYFFISLKQPYFTTTRKVIPALAMLFLVIYFSFFDNFFYTENLNGNLLSVEAYLLLIYCMLFYLSKLKEDDATIGSGIDFWIVTGLSIYVVINFFVFLFYVPMIKQNPTLADNSWDVHNIAYIILCLFIAKAFYVSDATKY